MSELRILQDKLRAYRYTVYTLLLKDMTNNTQYITIHSDSRFGLILTTVHKDSTIVQYDPYLEIRERRHDNSDVKLLHMYIVNVYIVYMYGNDNEITLFRHRKLCLSIYACTCMSLDIATHNIVRRFVMFLR